MMTKIAQVRASFYEFGFPCEHRVLLILIDTYYVKVGHERTLVHFLEEHARDLAAAAATASPQGSQSTATSTNEAQARRQRRPTFHRNISAMNATVSARGRIHVGALAVEVRY